MAASAVPIDLEAARTELAAAVGRTTALLRSLPGTDVALPSPPWTVRDAAAHLVVGLRVFASAARGQAPVFDLGQVDVAQQRVALLNERTIPTVAETDGTALGGLLDRELEVYLAATAGAGARDQLPTPWYGDGLGLDTAAATCVLVGEQVMHGYDMARATGRPWPISPDVARLVMSGATAMMPIYVNRPAAAGVRATFDIAVRGGPRFLLVVRDGTLTTEPYDGRRADCHISADPVAFLLVGYGRAAQAKLIATGKLVSWGRKPWLALSIKDLVLSP